MNFLRKKQSQSIPKFAKPDDCGPQKPLSRHLDENIKKIKAEIDSGDLIVSLLECNPDSSIQFACVYIDNLICY